MIYILHSENLHIYFKMQNATLKYFLKQLLKHVNKSLHDFNNTNLVTKVKIEHFHSHNKTVVDFNFGRH